MTPTEFEAARGYPTSTLLVKRLNEGATIPAYGSDAAAGMDLYANFHEDWFNTICLAPGERRLIKTGISIACPPSTYARIAPRSGLAYKHGIDVMAGVVDEDYRGDVGVILVNLGFRFDESGCLVQGEDVIVKHGDRIAQLIITQYLATLPVEVDSIEDTMRGGGGFGSTGG